jgi:hypothetical protein
MQHYEHLGNFQCSTLGLLSALTDVVPFCCYLASLMHLGHTPLRALVKTLRQQVAKLEPDPIT